MEDLAYAFACSKISSRARPFEISFNAGSDADTSADGTRAPNEAQLDVEYCAADGHGAAN